ncbi:hypothetical protein KR222_002004 [Zaprionus bogoriensis]|nr:hypothetical protein KR222_002004 [Zaprionus bogoriensis]
MLKAQRKQCCSLLLIGSLIISLALMISWWYLLPHQVQLLAMFRDGQNKSTSELKFYLPPQIVPKELKLKRGAPFIYQFFP